MTDPLSSLARPPDPAALARVRAALDGELKLPPPRSWRKDLLLFALVSAGLTLAAALAIKATSGWTDAGFAGRAAGLASLAAIQLTGAYASISPRARRAQIATATLAPLAMLLLVLLRGPGQPSLASPWVCTFSHLGLASVPLTVGLLLVRRAAVTPLRALAAGLTAGTVGASLGELACGQGAAHIAVYHALAWALAVILALLVSRGLKPDSFAP